MSRWITGKRREKKVEVWEKRQRGRSNAKETADMKGGGRNGSKL